MLIGSQGISDNGSRKLPHTVGLANDCTPDLPQRIPKQTTADDCSMNSHGLYTLHGSAS